jgi:hypothetical protein
LIIMLEAVGILAVAAVGRSAAGLDVGGLPRVGTEASKGGSGVKGAGAHLDVVGLEDQAALLAPIIVEGEDQRLEARGPVHFGSFAPATGKRLALAQERPAGQAERRRLTGRGKSRIKESEWDGCRMGFT